MGPRTRYGRSLSPQGDRQRLAQLLRALGFRPGMTLAEILDVSTELSGIPISVEYVLDSSHTTGLWVVHQGQGLLLLRQDDHPKYAEVTLLHEVGHIILRSIPDDLRVSFHDILPSGPPPARLMRLCSAEDRDGDPLRAAVERFVEDLALTFEGSINTQRRSRVEVNL